MYVSSHQYQDVEESEPACLSGEGGAVYSSGSGISLAGVILRRNRCETGGLDAGCSGGAVSVTGRGPSLSPAAAAAAGSAVAVAGGWSADRRLFSFLGAEMQCNLNSHVNQVRSSDVSVPAGRVSWALAVQVQQTNPCKALVGIPPCFSKSRTCWKVKLGFTCVVSGYY